MSDIEVEAPAELQYVTDDMSQAHTPAVQHIVAADSYPAKSGAAGDITGHVATRKGRNGGTLTPFDSVRAAEARARRTELAGQRVRRAAIKAGGQLPGVNANSSLDTLEYVAEQHWLNAADPSAPGSVQSFREVMRIAYPSPERGAAVSSVPAGGAQLNLSPELARELLAELRARRGG